MKRSRRNFLKTGTIAALATTVLPQALEKMAMARPGAPARLFEIPIESQSDPLFYYGRSTFQSYINSIFEIGLGRSWQQLTLESVTDTGVPKSVKTKRDRGVATDVVAENRFTLLFRGSIDMRFGQDTYTVRHAALGSFRLFLVPAAARDGNYYEAVINRVQK